MTLMHGVYEQVSLTDVAGGRASEHELQLLYGLVIIRAINGETLILTIAASSTGYCLMYWLLDTGSLSSRCWNQSVLP
jgi:hypothetical protein